MKKLIIFLGVLGVSLSAPLIRVSTAPSMVLVLYRVAIAAGLMLPSVLLRNRVELTTLSRKELLFSLMSGLFLGLHFSCYFEALRFTSIASAVVLVDTEVFFVALMMRFLFGERIKGPAWAGILITFAGSAVIALSDRGGGSDVLRGDLIALAGAASMAVYTIIGKVCRQRVSTPVYTFLVYASASLTVFVLLIFAHVPVMGYAPLNLLTALGMAVFCTLLGHSVFSWGLRYESAAFIATAKLLEPVFAAILGALLFREIPTAAVVLGGCLVIFGVFLYSYTSEKEQQEMDSDTEKRTLS